MFGAVISRTLIVFALAAGILWMPGAAVGEPPLAKALEDTHYVIKGRPKYIELRCFHESGVGVTDPDMLPATVIDFPDHGSLDLISEATYEYTPYDPNFVGTDTLRFGCGTWTEPGTTVTIRVVDPALLPMPLGMGAPSWGLPQNVTDYTRTSDQIYWVNVQLGRDCPGAEPCDNNPHWPRGTPLWPRRSLPTNLSPGDEVKIAGSGAPLSAVEITANGNAGSPIFIRARFPTNRPVLRQGLIIRGQYVVVENIDFDCSTPGSNLVWLQVREQTQTTGSHHVAIRHCTFANHPQSLDGAVFAMIFGATHGSSPPSPNNPTVGVTDCVVYDTVVHHFGNWQAQGACPGPSCPKDYLGCVFEGNTQDMWCLDSIFHHMQGSGAGISRNNALSYQAGARNAYFGRNVLHHTREGAIQVKFGRDTIISQNKIYRARLSNSTARGTGINIDNDDHCNANTNLSGEWYSDNIWCIFNHIYDVQTGVNAAQEIHCGGGLCCCDAAGHTCCSGQAPDPLPEYRPAYAGDPIRARVYVIGNVFNHINSFDHVDPELVGQAVGIGAQVQARVINNTIYKCVQGVTIGCTHDSGNPNDCPPLKDLNNLTRNTSVAIWNNVVLDTPNDGTNDTHVRVCTGPPIISQFTLTDHEFDRNLHYGSYRIFQIPSGPWDSVGDLVLDDLTDYGVLSRGDLPMHNPNFFDPANLLFYLRTTTPVSPFFMFNGGVKDACYTEFQTAFPSFPHIYRDYAGNAYSDENNCAIGALITVRE